MLYNDDDVERAAVALVSEWGMGPVDDEDRVDLRRVLDGCLPEIRKRWLAELADKASYRRFDDTGDVVAWLFREAGVDPCYCAETSVRNCPRHAERAHKKVSSFGDDTCSCGYDGWPCEA